MRKMKVGIQLYGLRNSMAEDFEGTLRAVRDLGYEYVEFAGYFGHTGAEIREILDRLGLKCVSVHQSLDFFEEDPEGKIAFLKEFGVKYNVIPWYGKEKLAGTPGWDETLAKFRSAADFFRDHGMMLGYHNHDFEFATYEGKYLHDYIFEGVSADRIIPEIDTCWVKYAGLDPAEKIRQFCGRVPIVHLKDFTCTKLGGGPVYALIDASGESKGGASREETGFEFRPVGMGMNDFASILAACDECGTEIVIVEQDATYGGMSEIEAARLSREYLKDTFGL